MKQADVDKIRKWLGTGSINIFGLPFSGKDTHGTQLARLFDAEIIGGGDILRLEGQQHVKAHIAKGNLAPTDEYLSAVLPYLSREKYAGKPLILSTVGRWHGEEKIVVRAAEEAGHPIKVVLYLAINEQEAESRWELSERGRDDDAEKNILLNRFREFNEKTIPVIDYYRHLDLLMEIDGTPPIETVTNEILKQLLRKATV